MTTQHTAESLMALVYQTQPIYEITRVEAALTEVLAELAQLKTVLAGVKLDEKELQSKCTEQAAEIERLKDEYASACNLVANMHAAAVGEITGPKQGVVEDVLNLRMERDTLAAKIAAMESQEPVGYQYRTKAEWLPEWGQWCYCNKEQHDDYLRAPKINDWHYEARALYTEPVSGTPGAALKVEPTVYLRPGAYANADQAVVLIQAAPAAQPLSDEQIASIVREAAKGAATRRDGTTSTRIARAIEQAHGIGKEQQA